MTTADSRKEQEAQRLADAEAEREKHEREARNEEQKQKWEEFWKSKKEYAKRNSLGAINIALEWSGEDVSVGLEGLEFHWSLLPYTSIGIGIYPYFYGGSTTVWPPDEFNLAIGGAFYAGLVYPLTHDSNFISKLYADGLFNISYALYNGGKMGPGFDTGIVLIWDDFVGLDIKYRGIWYESNYVNSVGIGWVLTLFD
jgi:hypothetical protein